MEILSGVFEGHTLGSPIGMLVHNQDARPQAYEHMKDVYRPSHADYTTEAKYGIRNWQGGGRASARETIGRVAAGAVARKLLRVAASVEVLAWVRQVREIEAKIDPGSVTLEAVESNLVRCPEPSRRREMVRAHRRGARARRLPRRRRRMRGPRRSAGPRRAGLRQARGRPGPRPDVAAGLEGLRDRQRLRGHAHDRDRAQRSLRERREDGRPHTTSNRSGGVQGGISNGEDIVLRVAFKPTATISQPQQTVDRDGKAVVLEAQGRHDPCVLPRAVPMVEAMVCLVLADHYLRQRSVDVLTPAS